MIVCKFLAKGAIGPFTGFAWPLPSDQGEGPWVEAEKFPNEGVHGLDIDDLAYWLHDELWIVELGGSILRAPTQIIASRGRLVRRVDRWNDERRRAFASDIVRRATERMPSAASAAASACFADLRGCAKEDSVAVTAFVAATLAAILANDEAAAKVERIEQATFLRHTLDLDACT
jgi:hypothetical protein